jgi:hypothetical protein
LKSEFRRGFEALLKGKKQSQFVKHQTINNAKLKNQSPMKSVKLIRTNKYRINQYELKPNTFYLSGIGGIGDALAQYLKYGRGCWLR